MRRYRITTINIDSTRNVLGNRIPASAEWDLARQQLEGSIKARYGDYDFYRKFERYMALQTPVLSVVGEHSRLLEDIGNAYVSGSFYSALTGACCLGERIFNDIIFKVMDDFKSSPQYKSVYGKGSIIDWDAAIKILVDWGLIDNGVSERYSRLARLRHESVHYQRKPQNFEQMSLEAINTINFIINRLFGVNEHRRKELLYFDVPGEVYVRKEAERDPLIKAYYLPCATLVGPKHEMEYVAAAGHFRILDNHAYENSEINDAEYVRLRKER